MSSDSAPVRSKRSALEASLQDWYAEDIDRKKQLERVVNGEAEFSLREIDWFVTNFSVRNPVVYTLPTGEVIDVNGDYKDVLKSFHKSAFDAFKRKGSDPSEAAMRQMNFFRWAMQNGVYQYVADHADTIKKDMSQMRKKQKTAASSSSHTPRRQTPGMGVAMGEMDFSISLPSFVMHE